MNPYFTFHAHTTFCDGKNTPEEMVQEAIRLSCPALGLSGHSNTPFDPGYCMDEGREAAYRQEVKRLQKACAGQIDLYLGLEQDYYSAPAHEDYQYLIGSVHYVKKSGEYISIDDTPQLLEAAVQKHYAGDWYALCEDYYALVSDVVNKTHCQVVGHMDLITKFLEKRPFFDPDHPRYRKAALQALHSLLDQKTLLEVNTGAISRGWRTTPYPASFLLEELGRCHTSVLLSSDAHRIRDLLCGLPQARALCDAYGIRTIPYP